MAAAAAMMGVNARRVRVLYEGVGPGKGKGAVVSRRRLSTHAIEWRVCGKEGSCIGVECTVGLSAVRCAVTGVLDEQGPAGAGQLGATVRWIE